jgi:deoxycytidylate deaminase
VNVFEALARAVEAAQLSPCVKSTRGVVIFRADTDECIIGFNHPPAPFTCDGSPACRAACGKVCVHAEAHALIEATKGLTNPWFLDEAEMLHVKVVDGREVPSGSPSCWQCSRLILESGISDMWLLHEEGLQTYTAEEFHRLTLEHCGLPVITEGSTTA